jgi:hypothetical protein
MDTAIKQTCTPGAPEGVGALEPAAQQAGAPDLLGENKRQKG